MKAKQPPKVLAKGTLDSIVKKSILLVKLSEENVKHI
jgi:hypothetical protein